jgi:hypothetical protein
MQLIKQAFLRGAKPMRLSVYAFSFLVLLGFLATPISSQDIGPTGPIPYDIVESWAKPFAGEGFAFGGNSGVYAESPDRIIVLQRGETRLPDPVPPEFDGWAGPLWNVLSGRGRTWQNCIYVLDRNGNLIEVWDQWDHLFEDSDGPGPHRIRVSPYDPERRIWIVHETAHQIFVLSNDGKELLKTFGERNVSGTDETHFGLPQDVGFLPDGRVLIADGYDNSRVMVLDASWNYQTEFGKPGDGPGEFQVVHSIAMAPGGRILVADRDNRRVQIFSESDYAYMGEIQTGALALDIIVSGNSVFISDVGPPRLRQFDLDGNPVYTWHGPDESSPHWIREMHSIGVDSEGNLYAADNQNGRIQKLTPKPDANPSFLVGQPYVPR